MTKETIKSIGRALLTLVGTVLLGKNVFGHVLDENVLQEIFGALGILGGVLWGILDHSATIEKVQSGLHSSLIILAGVAVSWGVISQQTALAIIGLVTALIPVILSYTSKVKIQQIDAGKLTTDSTTGKAIKATILIGLLVFLGTFGARAQGFFKPIPKNTYTSQANVENGHVIYGDSVQLTPVSKMHSFRPVLNFVTYSEPDHVLMAGAGVSYQWLHLDATTKKWYADYAINFLFYGGATVTTPNKGVYAAGLSFSALNGLISLGVSYNFTTAKIGPTAGGNASLNN